MSDEEYADLELARRYLFDSGETERVKIYLAGLRAERERAAKKCDDRAKLLNVLGSDADVELTGMTVKELQSERVLEAKACAAAIRGGGG